MSAGSGWLEGRLLLGGQLVPGRVSFAAGRITMVQRASLPLASTQVIAPGLIDLHVHGYGGAGPVEDLEGMARALARHGTTAFQPTLFPEQPAALGERCSAVWSRAQALAARAGIARVLGLHLEGPFVSPRSAGALSLADLAEPSVAGLRAILGPASGAGRGVRTMTIAPELPGTGELIRELARSGIHVSLGHSTASAAEARAASLAGARGVTHLYNAMSGAHHREPGLAGFALSDDALSTEIIGDLVHVGPEAFEIALRARAGRGLCLVSDALAGAGTGCELFHASGRAHLVRAGAAWYPPAKAGDEPRLAGSATGQWHAIQRLVRRGVLELHEALELATAAPARALGLERDMGVLQVGARASFVLVDSVAMELAAVWIDGERLEPGVRE